MSLLRAEEGPCAASSNEIAPLVEKSTEALLRKDSENVVNKDVEVDEFELKYDNYQEDEDEEEIEFMKKFRNLKGMGWFVTMLFIVGETAGGGMIALPRSVVSAGLEFGLALLIFGLCICVKSSWQLAQNWTIMQRRFPQYRDHCRDPYPSMGYRALGPKCRTFVACVLNVTQFGTAVVFLLLASRNMETFLALAHLDLSYCYIICAVGAALLPITFLNSPKDFWALIVMAMFTTLGAVFMIAMGSHMDMPLCREHVTYPTTDIKNIFMSFGTVMFAYGGHAAFPTIQHDMKKPYRFNRSSTGAFICIFLIYLPTIGYGYYVYGDALQSSIISNLQNGTAQLIANVCITVHVVLALTIIFNPLNQGIEKLFDVPNKFGWARVLTRSSVMVAVIFIGLTFPTFGVLLDLVGGSTITMMALGMPAVFNLYLKAAANKHGYKLANKDERPVTFAEMIHYNTRGDVIYNFFILVVTVVCGVMTTSAATQQMMTASYAQPCWWGIISHVDEHTPATFTNASAVCCGPYHNISWNGPDYCLDPFKVSSAGGHG